MQWTAWIWVCLMVVFLLVEASTVTLVSLWFAAGSLAALLVSALGGSLMWQNAVFILVSAVLLMALRPLARKYLTPKRTRTNVDSVIGSMGLVTVAVDNVQAEGQAKLGTMVWTARSTSGERIPEGTLVRVDRIEGVKVFVTPVKTPANV